MQRMQEWRKRGRKLEGQNNDKTKFRGGGGGRDHGGE